MPGLSLRSILPAVIALTLAGCDESPADRTGAAVGGDAQRGAKLIGQLGCGSCHAIPGITGARGKVGPPLDTIGDRVIIAGVLPNTPENLMRWIRAPQSVVPGNAMPDMGLSDHDAQDVAAYLYTLR